MTLRCGALFLALLAAVSGQASPKAVETPETLLRTLYANHKPQNDRGIDFDKKDSLKRYFSPELIALFARDTACKERTQEICNLDFDPILAAQDFDDQPLNLVIEKLSATRFKVTYTNIDRRSQIYEIRDTKSGPRIDDILYPDSGSLKKILTP